MKTIEVLGQDATDLTRGDVDAKRVQLFEQQRLRDVAVVLLVQDIANQDRPEVTAGQDSVR